MSFEKKSRYPKIWEYSKFEEKFSNFGQFNKGYITMGLLQFRRQQNYFQFGQIWFQIPYNTRFFNFV